MVHAIQLHLSHKPRSIRHAFLHFHPLKSFLILQCQPSLNHSFCIGILCTFRASSSSFFLDPLKTVLQIDLPSLNNHHIRFLGKTICRRYLLAGLIRPMLDRISQLFSDGCSFHSISNMISLFPTSIISNNRFSFHLLYFWS